MATITRPRRYLCSPYLERPVRSIYQVCLQHTLVSGGYPPRCDVCSIRDMCYPGPHGKHSATAAGVPRSTVVPHHSRWH